MSVLKKPLVTEKMTLLGEKEGQKQYGFVVDLGAKKPEIKTAIQEMYDVNVVSLRTMIVAGKKRSRYSKSGVIEGRSSNVKKAIVTLAEGEEIDFYKNI